MRSGLSQRGGGHKRRQSPHSCIDKGREGLGPGLGERRVKARVRGEKG